MRRQLVFGDEAARARLIRVWVGDAPRRRVFLIDVLIDPLKLLELVGATRHDSIDLLVTGRRGLFPLRNLLSKHVLQQPLPLLRRGDLVEAAHLDHHLVQSQLLLRARVHLLLHGTQRDQTKHGHGAGRADAVGTILRLDVLHNRRSTDKARQQHNIDKHKKANNTRLTNRAGEIERVLNEHFEAECEQGSNTDKAT